MSELKIRTLKIVDLKFDPKNAREHNEKNIDAIKGSLTRFGLQKPIVVDENNIIVAGNGTVAAAMSLGWTEIDCVVSDLNGNNITAYALADNRTAELAAWDMAVLGKTLSALQDEGFGIADIGFNPDEYAHLMGDGDLVDDPLKEWTDVPEFNQSDMTSVKKLIVHFKTTEDYAKFAALIGQPLTEDTKSVWYPQEKRQTLKDKAYVPTP
jgi:hypothetical protein